MPAHKAQSIEPACVSVPVICAHPGVERHYAAPHPAVGCDHLAVYTVNADTPAMRVHFMRKIQRIAGAF